ncbi:hypothetical protein [Flavobacterium sp. LB3R33]|uniref:hypothetical protein n=1 Tax=Flavobacterium sp. LB3R33 TaxID=3401721 RepID=UPI003AABB1D6
MRIIYSLIVMLFITVTINAQTKESTDLNSIVDYVTCVCVNDALPDNKKIDCDNDQLTLSTIPENETATIYLYNEFQKIKEKTKISNSLQFFTEDVFNNEKQFSKIYAFAKSRKEKNTFNPLKLKIEKFIQNKGMNETGTDLNSDVNTNTETSESTVIDNSQSVVAVDDDLRNYTTPTPSSSIFSSNLWTIVLTVLIILTIVLLFILNRRISGLEKNLKNEIEKSKTGKTAIPISNLSFDYSTKIRNLENSINNIESQLKNSVQKNLSNNILTDSTSKEIKNEIELKISPKPIQEVFYMATPDQNNFDISSLSNTFKPTQSLYEFKVDNNDKSKASFTFYSDEIGIRDAVNYPHTYLDPVCESQNALNQNAKSINTIKPGIAEKRNDKWVVTTKAKIKYE